MVWQVPQEPPSPPGEDAGHGNKANHDQRKTKVSGRARPLRDGPPDMQHGQQAEENAGGDKVRFHKVSTDRCMRPMVIILNWKVKVSVGAQAAPQGQFMKGVGTTRPWSSSHGPPRSGDEPSPPLALQLHELALAARGTGQLL